MFNFSVKNLGFLKDVPLLPLLFESFLQLYNSLFQPEINAFTEKIEDTLSSWKGVTITIHKYGGLQFNFKGKQIGHIHGNGLLDILFTKAIRDKLIDQGKAFPHHVFPNSGWISFYIRSESDIEKGISLLQLSLDLKMINDVQQRKIL